MTLLLFLLASSRGSVSGETPPRAAWVQDRLPRERPANAPMESIFMKSLRVVYFPYCASGRIGGGSGLRGLNFGIVGIMAVYAEEVGPFARPLKKPTLFAVDPGLPVAIDVAVALAAEPV